MSEPILPLTGRSSGLPEQANEAAAPEISSELPGLKAVSLNARLSVDELLLKNDQMLCIILLKVFAEMSPTQSPSATRDQVVNFIMENEDTFDSRTIELLRAIDRV